MTKQEAQEILQIFNLNMANREHLTALNKKRQILLNQLDSVDNQIKFFEQENKRELEFMDFVNKKIEELPE